MAIVRSCLLAAGLLTIGSAVAACRTDSAAAVTRDPPASTAPVPGHVTDLARFEAFIATRPTPDEFRQRYPDVRLVMPGTVATKELRTDNSRYFARIEDGRIVGGRFM